MLSQILFLDIETVSQHPSFNELSDEWKQLWSHKAEFIISRGKETDTAETVYGRAGIYAEFGKIICISCGFISGNGKEKN